MNTVSRTLNYKLLRKCQRFVSLQSSCKEKPQWAKPAGHETNIIVYNTVAKCKVPLVLKNKEYLTWYVCGPTVYDSAHIGHAATYVKTDIIRRILSEYFNLNVVMAMGITDIDDKIINRANEMNVDYKTITRMYEDEFKEDLKELNVLEPTLYCRVTEFIPEVISFVQGIVQKNYAYTGKDGSVYFDTTKYSNYGKFSNSSLDTSHPDKKSASDFALWKSAKPGEPFWESPWGPGRPGWHTECSAIGSTIFGQCIDLHSGGIDLAFPHHENEEAQSCCFHETNQWVNYWLHCGHLHREGDVKMSKSLKNTVSVKELLQTHTSNEFRMLCLLSNYRYGIEFTDIIMQTASSVLNKLQNFLNDSHYYVSGKYKGGNVDEPMLLQFLHETKNRVNTSLSDDFNTAQAMQSLIKLMEVANKMLNNDGEGQKTTGARNVAPIAVTSNYISDVLTKLGVTLHTANRGLVASKVNDIIEQFVQFRHTVRQESLSKDKNKVLLAACDQARAALQTNGVTVKDGSSGPIWYIKN